MYKVYEKEYEDVSIAFHKSEGVIAVGDSEMVIEHYLKLIDSLPDSGSCNELYLVTLPNSDYTQVIIDFTLSQNDFILKFIDYVKYNPNVTERDLSKIIQSGMYV